MRNQSDKTTTSQNEIVLKTPFSSLLKLKIKALVLSSIVKSNSERSEELVLRSNKLYSIKNFVLPRLRLGFNMLINSDIKWRKVNV